MKNLCFLLFIVTTTLLQHTGLAYSSILEIVTTDFPPYQTQTGAKLEGFATETVQEVLALSGHAGHIAVYPWPRAYQTALTTPNTLIYSLARIPEREKLFQWIGTVAPFDVYVWRLKKRAKVVHPKNIEESKAFIMGGVFHDIKAAYLEKQGFKPGQNLEMVRSDDLNARKLYSGHIDLLPCDEISFPYLMKKAGLDANLAEKVYKIPEISEELYLAASIDTSAKTVADIKVALEKFKKSLHYKKIKAKYLK